MTACVNFGVSFENQYRLALAIANIGSFGTLKKQERTPQLG